MGVKCQILLKKTREGVFRAGQFVVGNVKFVIDKPTQFEKIDICLVGNGKCHWSETESDNTYYYKNEEEYVNQNSNLLAREGKNMLSGNFDHAFEFMLPDDIPTSIKNSTCTIEYKVIVTFIKDNFFRTKYKFDAEVPVYGFVSPCSPEPLIFGLQKKLLSLTTNYQINVKAELERTFVTPGENIALRLTVNNDSDVPITIKTELVKHFTYVAAGNKKKKIDKESVKTTEWNSPILMEQSVSELTCIVPTLPSLYSIQHTEILIGEYKVRVTAKLPFPHINAEVEVPVVIGERRDHLGAAVVSYDGGKPSTSDTPEKYETYMEKQ